MQPASSAGIPATAGYIDVRPVEEARRDGEEVWKILRYELRMMPERRAEEIGIWPVLMRRRHDHPTPTVSVEQRRMVDVNLKAPKVVRSKR